MPAKQRSSVFLAFYVAVCGLILAPYCIAQTITTPPGVVVPFRPQTIYAPVAGIAEFAIWDLAVVNRSPTSMPATVTVYSAGGEILFSREITLIGNETRHFDLKKIAPMGTSSDPSLGGVSIAFSGQSLGIGAQVTISGLAGFGNIDAPVFDDVIYKSNTSDAVWWESPNSRSHLILGNSSSEEIHAKIEFGNGKHESLDIAPHATVIERIPISRQESSAGGTINSVHVVGTGAPGTLRVTGYVASLADGFVNTIRAYDPFVSTEAAVYANGLHFSGGESRLIVKNLSSSTITVTGTIYPAYSKAENQFTIPVRELAAGASGELELPSSRERDLFDDAALKITSFGESASIIAAYSNHDADQRLTRSVAFKDVGDLSVLTGAYPWRLDGDYKSKVFVTNVGATKASLGAKILPLNGPEYLIDTKYLDAGETVVFDIGKLRDDKIPDPRGVILPKDATVGQFWWSSIFGDGREKLIGRNEVIDRRSGLSASFSCNSCNCPTSTPSAGLTPGSLEVFSNQVYSTLVAFASGVNTCTGQSVGNFSISPSSWNIQTPGYFSLSAGSSPSTLTATAVSGSSTFYTPFTGTDYAWNGGTGVCFLASQPVLNPGGAAAVVKITLSKPLWFFGAGNTPPPAFTLGAITSTLTANNGGNGTYVWTITGGTTKAVLENNTSTMTKSNINTVGITSTSYSTAANDVTIQLKFTPSGGPQITATFALGIDSPYRLTSLGATQNAGIAASNPCSSAPNGTAGYRSTVPYGMLSFFGASIENEYINEVFGTPQDVYVGNNWPAFISNPPFLSPDGTFSDIICVESAPGLLTPVSLPPQSPLLSTLIDKVSQSWYIGSQTSGSGPGVQSNTLERFQDHAVHISVISPVR
jgi:hypothetical protein